MIARPLQWCRAALVLNGLLCSLAGCSKAPPSSGSHPHPSVVTDEAGPVQWLNLGTRVPDLAAIRPDGRIAVVQTAFEAIVYDLESTERLYAWKGRFAAVRFSRDGRFLLTIKGDEAVLWNASTFDIVRRFSGRAPRWNEPGFRGGQTTIAISDHGDHVAIVNNRGSFERYLPHAVLLYRTSDGQQIQSLPIPHGAGIVSLDFVPGRDRLMVQHAHWASSGNSRRYVLWDIVTGEPVREFAVGDFVRVSPDGRQMLTGQLVSGSLSTSSRQEETRATELTLWDTATLQPQRTFTHAHPPRDFTFSPDNRRILAAIEIRVEAQQPAARGQLIEWDLESGQIVFESDESEHPYANVYYSSEGRRRLASAEFPSGVDDDLMYELRGWDADSGMPLSSENFPELTYNRQAELFFFPGDDRFIDFTAPFAVRDIVSGKTVKMLPEYREEILDAAFAAKETQVVSAPKVTVVPGSLIDLASGKRRDWQLPGKGYRFVNGGRTLFTWNHGGLYLTDLVTGKTVWELPLQVHYHRLGAAVSADAGKIVVTQTVDLGAHRYAASSAGSSHAESPDVFEPFRLIVIDTSRPDDPLILQQYAAAVAIHPDGTRFLAAAAEAVEERDLETGEKLRTLLASPGRVLSIAYNADGTQVLAGGVVGHRDPLEPVDEDDNGWAMLWNQRLNRTVALTGHYAPVSTVAFAPDGSRCVTGSYDHTIRLWDTEQAREREVFRGHRGLIHRVDYSPCGTRLLSAAKDGAAVWSISDRQDSAGPRLELADVYTRVETVNALSGHSTVSGGGLFPELDQRHPATIEVVQGDWTAIEVNRSKRRDLPRDAQNWLLQAKETQQIDAPPPQANTNGSQGFEHYGVSRDGQRILYLSRRDQKLLLCNPESEILQEWEWHRDAAHAAIAPSGREVVIAYRLHSERGVRHEVRVYDADSGEAKRTIGKYNASYVNQIAIAPDEATILLQVNNNWLISRDYQTGEALAELPSPASGAGTLATFSPEGRFLITSKFPDVDVILRDPRMLQPVKILTNHLSVRWFTPTPDGQRLLVGQSYSTDRDLMTLWDLESGKRLWSRSGPSGGNGSFSADGSRYLSQHGWYLWTLWDLENGNPICAVVTSGFERPILAGSGALHLGSLDALPIWPSPDAAGRQD